MKCIEQRDLARLLYSILLSGFMCSCVVAGELLNDQFPMQEKAIERALIFLDNIENDQPLDDMELLSPDLQLGFASANFVSDLRFLKTQLGGRSDGRKLIGIEDLPMAISGVVPGRYNAALVLQFRSVYPKGVVSEKVTMGFNSTGVWEVLGWWVSPIAQ